MLQKVLKLGAYLLLAIFFIVTLAFTSNESKNIPCRNIAVEFASDEIIKLNNDEVIRLVKIADNQLLEKTLQQINADFIEKEVEKHPAILKADVYKVIAKDTSSYKGILAVKIKHRKPIVRVMSNSGNYYLDEFGLKIPISTNYSANVLAATGYFDEQFAKNKLLPFILFLEADEFWKAQIEQVHIEKNGNVILTPLVGDHLIDLGNLEKFSKKLRNMKAFYEQVLAKNNWNKYKRISLKYNNQVIAKKR